MAHPLPPPPPLSVRATKKRTSYAASLSAHCSILYNCITNQPIATDNGVIYSILVNRWYNDDRNGHFNFHRESDSWQLCLIQYNYKFTYTV